MIDLEITDTKGGFEINEFSDDLVNARKFAKSYPYKCCYPNCGKNAVKSHLLQQHPVLDSICDERNRVFQMVDNDIDPRSGKWGYYSQREVGIRDAFQYKLFCDEHDDSLFKKIEGQNSIPDSKRDCLLLAFRSSCAVRHQEEHRLHFYEWYKKSKGLEHKQEVISRLFIQRMDGVVNNLWAAIKGDEEKYYCFRMIAMPRIDMAVSDCIIDEDDLKQHIMDDNCIKPLDSLFINLIPFEDKLYLLLGCDTRYDCNGKYKEIIEQFPTGDVSSDYYLGSLKGILLKCRNWCCSPKLYEDVAWKEFFDEYESLKVLSESSN